MEMWKPLPGFEGEYAVSNLGRVKSLARPSINSSRQVRGVIRKQNPNSHGYSMLKLYHADGTWRGVSVHRMVALAFLGPCPIGKNINHKNGDKMDNRVDNLEYTTQSENLRHAYEHLGVIGPRGERQGHAKLTERHVLDIKQLLADTPLSHSQIARLYSVTRECISRINQGKNWWWLQLPSEKTK